MVKLLDKVGSWLPDHSGEFGDQPLVSRGPSLRQTGEQDALGPDQLKRMDALASKDPVIHGFDSEAVHHGLGKDALGTTIEVTEASDGPVDVPVNAPDHPQAQG